MYTRVQKMDLEVSVSPTSLIDQIVVPGDIVLDLSSMTDQTIKFGIGFRQDGDAISAMRAGKFSYSKPTKFWYIPRPEDHVLGIVDSKADNFWVDIEGPQLGPLPVLAFEGGTRRNIPKFEGGTLLYVRVVRTNTETNPELSYTDASGKVIRTDYCFYQKTAEFGPLKDGFVFEISTGLSRMLLSSPTCPVLEDLGKNLSFEIAIGLNGRVWVNAPAPRTVMNGEEPMTFMKLPNDLVINCLARVSRLHYHTLSLVSKRFRSLLASTELYQTRTLLGCTENCLYVCLKRPTYTSPECWFTLCLTPNSSKKVMVPITSPNSPYAYQTGIARVGSNIYSIGGSISRDKASSKVMVMDCHSHTWSEGPSMLVAREVPSVCVLDGKIYVTGGCKNLDESNWMEVFDVKTQTWEFKLSDNSKKVCNDYRYQSIGYDGTVYVKCLETHEVYKLHKGRWRAGDLSLRRWSSSCCVIDNVLYTSGCGIINWYDSEVKSWKGVKGLERSFGSRPYGDAKLAEYGGKLAVFWEDDVLVDEFHNEKKIWYGEIAITVKRQVREIWGALEWFDIVSATNEPFDVAHVLSVTL